MDNEERPVEKDDEYKEVASGKGNTLIDVTGYAFCHCHARGLGQTQQEAWGFASARHNRRAMFWEASRARNGPDRRSQTFDPSRYRCEQVTFFIKQGNCPDTRRARKTRYQGTSAILARSFADKGSLFT